MSKSARVRSLINSLFLFSIFVELTVVELLVVWFSKGNLETSTLFMISFGAFIFYSLAYLMSNRILNRKLKRRQITADDYVIETRIPLIAYILGAVSFFFLHAQLLPTTTIPESLFNSIPQPDLYRYAFLDSIFSYEIKYYAHEYYESSSWLINSNVLVSIIGSLTMGTELLFALRSQKKAETSRAH